MVKSTLLAVLACSALFATSQAGCVADNDGTCTSSSASDSSVLIQKKVTLEMGSEKAEDGEAVQPQVHSYVEGTITNADYPTPAVRYPSLDSAKVACDTDSACLGVWQGYADSTDWVILKSGSRTWSNGVPNADVTSVKVKQGNVIKSASGGQGADLSLACDTGDIIDIESAYLTSSSCDGELAKAAHTSKAGAVCNGKATCKVGYNGGGSNCASCENIRMSDPCHGSEKTLHVRYTCQATCGPNEKVVSHVCTACPAGKTNAAGDDTSGDDTTCDATTCGADQKVESNVCTECPAGKTNAAGDDASGADTTCDATTCGADQKVESNVCTECPAGKTNAAGDDASGADTTCFWKTEATWVTYQTHNDKNTWNDHGSTNIDFSHKAPYAEKNLSELQCKQRCTDDPSCDCVVWKESGGKCWRRKACTGPFSANAKYDVFVKEAASAPADDTPPAALEAASAPADDTPPAAPEAASAPADDTPPAAPEA